MHTTTAQKEFDATRRWMMFSDAPNALYHHLRHQADELLRARSRKVAEIQTLADWRARQQWIAATLMDVVGPFPEKTPLNARVTKTIRKDRYILENIVYESQPGFYVTASLFVPAGLKRRERAPAIIYCSGHAATAYRSAPYQRVILNLVSKGFVVLAFDPVGQGERLGYVDPETGKWILERPTWEHSYPGAQLFMTGTSLAHHMIWDGIRAVDYLLTRKEVDPNRIGITGRSGGGTQSAYIAAFDDRIKAAAPENYITNFSMLFGSIGPQDAEQNFFQGIYRGLDMADLLAVRAPKPALMITTTRDMFPIHGSMETADEVSRVYEAYGKASDFSMITDDAVHTSTEKNRVRMYAFFQKHLAHPGDSLDEDIPMLSDDELRVTATGQVITSLKGETIFSLNEKEVEKRSAAQKATRDHKEIVRSARELSGYREPERIGESILTGRVERDGYVIEKFFTQGEGDYPIPYLLFTPQRSNHKAVIYMNPLGKQIDSSEGGEMEWLVKRGFVVLAPDLVGTGEMGRGDFKGDSYIDSVNYNIWFASILVGRSITGIQAGDVIRLARILERNKDIQAIYGVAKGDLSPVLLHAAAFDNAIAQVALLNPYISFRSVAITHYYRSAFVQSTVPGAIGVCDLPDLAATLAPRKFMIAGATDGAGKRILSAKIDDDLSIIRAAYEKQGATNNLYIVDTVGDEQFRDVYEEWMSD